LNTLKLSLILILLLFQNVFVKANEVGLASYYADKFVGRKTSSGELYSHDKMTCAHRTLPFGTTLKITCTKNGKSVYVKVNDRGPFKEGRVVDLSKRAAIKLGLLQWGHAEVKVEQVSEADVEMEMLNEMIAEAPNPIITTTPETKNLHKMNMQGANIKGWAIQIGSYTSHEGLMNMYENLETKYKNAVFFKNAVVGSKTYFRMYIAPFDDKEEALRELEKIKLFIENPVLVEL